MSIMEVVGLAALLLLVAGGLALLVRQYKSSSANAKAAMVTVEADMLKALHAAISSIHALVSKVEHRATAPTPPVQDGGAFPVAAPKQAVGNGDAFPTSKG